MYLKMREAFFLVNAEYKTSVKKLNITAPVQPGFYASSPAFLEGGQRIMRSPTTGMSAIIFAMSHCDHVSVYGFTVSQPA
jgi:hypothetical protein